MSFRPCGACGGERFHPVLDLGPMPVAHRFSRPHRPVVEGNHPLAVEICDDCALIQIRDPIPPDELYREDAFCFSAWKAQPHMDREVVLLQERLAAGDRVCEIGCNDGQFLLQLRAAGFCNLVGVEPNRHSSLEAQKAGFSVFQGFLDVNLAHEIRRSQGAAKAVVARQVVEHVGDLRGLFEALDTLLEPGGWLLLEVPDFEVPLQYGDCTALWEEHVNYFTEPVLHNLLARQGYRREVLERYPFSGGALMILAQRVPDPGELAKTADTAAIRALATQFEGRVSSFRSALDAVLAQARVRGEVNALYGSGCRANVILNGLELGPYFGFVVDDQIEKQGLLVPGCHLEIRPSAALYEGARHCYMSVNHENEAKVLRRHERFVEHGGHFYSLNSPSPAFVELAQRRSAGV